MAVLTATAGWLEARYLLGVLERLEGRLSESMAAQQAVLAADQGHEAAAIELARLFNAGGKPAEAIACTSVCAARAKPAQALLVERARAWQALNRPDQRLETRERIARLYPGSAATLHNLAAAQGDAGYAAEAERSARQALGVSSAPPETWLVLARALQGQGKLDQADDAFGEAIKRRSSYREAVRDRAQLLWMRTGNITQVLERLAVDGSGLGRVELDLLAAGFLATAGDVAGAYRLASGSDPHRFEAQAVAARLMMSDDPELALSHARRALTLMPGARDARVLFIDALLATQQGREAIPHIERELAQTPFDQALIAARWTAWRIEQDPRADALYAYDATVSTQTIDVPTGWSDLGAYLTDLAEALGRAHRFAAHPLDQSLRGGAQTGGNLLRSHEPAIRGFQDAIDGPIHRYLAQLGAGTDPLRSRLNGDYRITGLWSVRLDPAGRHLPHVHPSGWISSACHIAVPSTISDHDHAGWLKLGEPAHPSLPAQRYIKPQPGHLVLFPSYMWHATEPFTGIEPRLSIAFDIAPAHSTG